jgi:hypothetical protein
MFETNRRRHITSRTPEQCRLVVYKMHNRVIDLPVNFPVVHQERVGDITEAFDCFAVFAINGSSLILPLVITKTLSSAKSR